MLDARRRLSSLLAAAVLLAPVVLFSGPALGQAAERTPERLWADFNHYVLIARVDLAASSGQALLQATEPGELLDVVEASDYDQFQQTLDRAARVPELTGVSSRIQEALAQARLERAGDPERIGEDIARLAVGQRAYANAVTRLRAAGQRAVPAMLAAMNDPARERLRPYLTTALTDMGEPAVYPLAVALPHLDGPTQRRVARVLADIGYPLPLPFLRQVIEDDATDDAVRDTLAEAYARLAQGLDGLGGAPSAASLFIALAHDQYGAGTADRVPSGFELQSGEGLLWRFNPTAGLVSVGLPESVFADVLTMQSASHALELDPESDEALRLWLTANLRREIRLGEGEVDPTYGPDRRPPSFYALLAGPNRLLTILATALGDEDPDLALAALKGLDATAATEALIASGAAAGPMLRALTSDDAAVRFEAAAVMADARPQSSYEGADRVVPVLAEAVAGSLDDEEATLRAIALLRDIGVASAAYDLTLAEVELTEALSADEAVATAAAGVASMLPSTDAQRALAEAAFAAEGSLQLTMLHALADSATRFGNRLNAGQADTLGALTREGDDDTALAAARAYGALALPTQSAVERIFDR